MPEESEEIARELYRYAREVWRVWSGRAGWRGRISYEDAIQSAVAHCWAVHAKHDPELSSRRSFFTLCARRCITEISNRQRAQKRQGRAVALVIEPEDDAPRPCELAERSDEVARLMDATRGLSFREGYVLRRRYVDDCKLADLGDELGMSHEGARQIELKAMRRLTATLGGDRVQP